MMPAACERERGGPVPEAAPPRLAGGKAHESAAKAPGASRGFGSKTEAFDESARPELAASSAQTVLVPASVSVFQKACVSSTTCAAVGSSRQVEASNGNQVAAHVTVM